MVAAATNWAPLLTPPLTFAPSLKGLVDRIPSRPAASQSTRSETCEWPRCRELKSVLGINDAPALESDTVRRRRPAITFVHIKSHPLAAQCPAAAAVEHYKWTVPPRPGRGTAPTRKQRTTLKNASSVEPVYRPSTEVDAPETEMTTWRQRHVPLRQTDAPQLPRFNRDFLRMFIAQKLMFEHGKIKEISCSPLLPPRPRVSLNPQCTLGVRHSWNKTHRQREWRDLLSQNAVQ